MYNKSIKILNNIGISDITVEDIILNKRLTSTLGRYSPDLKLIEISTRHFICGEYNEVINTIIHEIIHNICHNRYDDQDYNNGHTKEWFK